ncbi:MAG: GIY-YIG nuclease family protein [Candidatus Thorarchaeota archaeon]
MNFGRKIELFLVKGDPAGLRKAKIANWEGQAFAAYRSDIGDFLSRTELQNNPGIYLLIGVNEEYDTTVYVGETENIAERIRSHLNKEFWNQCIAFISKAGSLNKGHVRWLEGSIYNDLEKAGQVILKNENKPSLTPLSEADIAVMEEFKANIYLILGTLGFTGINEASEKKKEKTSLIDYTFKLARYGKVLAQMKPTTTGYKVLKGSILRPDKDEYRNTSSLKLHYLRRDSLREKGIVQTNENGEEILNKDQIFQSPSGASSFILGGTSNGRTDWKTDAGKTFKEIEEILSE